MKNAKKPFSHGKQIRNEVVQKNALLPVPLRKILLYIAAAFTQKFKKKNFK